MVKVDSTNGIIYVGDIMYGTIIGDIAGSYYEMHNIKTKKFKFMDKNKSSFTDDTVMTLAVCKSLLECDGNYSKLHDIVINNMVTIGRNHSQCGFGDKFFGWIIKDDHSPYNSFGNGAAMRVGCCGIVGKNMEEVKKISKIVTEVSHNHEEALKAAEAVSVAVFLAKTGSHKEKIKKYIIDNYYDLNFTLEEKRASYGSSLSCQDSVPQAFVSFFEAKNYEDAIRNAISIGGDSDTVAAIAGVIAGEYYGIPLKFIKKAQKFFDFQWDEDLINVMINFEKKYPTKKKLF